jgi:hypothetical protein
MNVDLYTKAVLTVIAGCLVWICATSVTPVAEAQGGAPQPTPVVLVDERGRPLVAAEGLRVNLGPQTVPVIVSNAAVPVVVNNPTLPVDLRSIQRGARWDAMDVHVLREPPTLQPVP